jgi:3-hydroxybutyryl-CoA dehydratase
MISPAPGFHGLEIGQVLRGRLTVTESHIVLASGIFADFAPLHTDEVFARQTRYGSRIAHGTLVTGIMTGVLSKALGTNAMGMLEQHVRFVAPVMAGDTLSTSWEVTEKTEKPGLGGGIVRLTGACETQSGTVVVEGATTLLVSYGDEADGA